MAATLTAPQITALVNLFSQNAYVIPQQTATNGTDVLATAASQIDSAVAVSIGSGAASANVAVSLIGNFTAQQLEILMAYVLLKRASLI